MFLSAKASAHHLLGRALEVQSRGCEAAQEYSLALDNAYNSASPGFNLDAVSKNTERLRNQYSCFAR
ncbi:MAG: hypothetical protein MOB07_20690 [Acidobacteria bacterium]|nr:hypothetical protein [Acidobacteriota bacterium]